MIERSKALGLAERHFPRGPEEIAKQYNIPIRPKPLPRSVSGWCVRNRQRALIVINSNHPDVRQRFSLAHELAHLILDAPPHALQTPTAACEVFAEEEREVNALAGDLLLPLSHVRRLCPSPPLDARCVERIAERARVSLVAAGCRVAHLARDLNLENAAVIGFDGGTLRWTFSRSLALPDGLAERLLPLARQVHPAPYRMEQPRAEVILASLLETPLSVSLFVQRLPTHVGSQLTEHERIRQLEQDLFGGDPSFRHTLNGCIGAFNRPEYLDGRTLDVALEEFNRRYRSRHTGERGLRFEGQSCQEYLRLRLAQLLR